MESGENATKLVRCHTCNSWTKASWKSGADADEPDGVQLAPCRLCHLERRIGDLEQLLEAFVAACIKPQAEMAVKLSELWETRRGRRDGVVPDAVSSEDRKVSLVRLRTLSSERPLDTQVAVLGNLTDGVSRWQKIKASISGPEVPSEDNPFVGKTEDDPCLAVPDAEGDEHQHLDHVNDTTDMTSTDDAKLQHIPAKSGSILGAEPSDLDANRSKQESIHPTDGLDITPTTNAGWCHTPPGSPRSVQLKWKPLKFSIQEVVRAPAPTVLSATERSPSGGSGSTSGQITGASVLSALLAKNTVRMTHDGTLRVIPKSDQDDSAISVESSTVSTVAATIPAQPSSVSPRSPLAWKKLDYAAPKRSATSIPVRRRNISERARSFIPRRKVDPRSGKPRSHSVDAYDSG